MEKGGIALSLLGAPSHWEREKADFLIREGFCEGGGGERRRVEGRGWRDGGKESDWGVWVKEESPKVRRR